MLNLKMLTDVLNIEQLDTYLFRGQSIIFNLPRVFGGQVLGQALNAANRSVAEDRRPHSMHAYFLRPGNAEKPIIYDVDPIRDGGSFSTRRVVAKQDGRAIFNSSISFHKLETDQFEHQMEWELPPPPPDQFEPDDIALDKLIQQYPDAPRPFTFPSDVIDLRTPEPRNYFKPEPREPIDGFWFRIKDLDIDDPIIHRTLLAFVSDKRLMGTGIRAHPVSFLSGDIMGASLDHSLWFHSDIRVNQWIYYHMDSPKSGRARTFSRGSFYTKNGALIASSAQEGLFRKLTKKEG